MRSFESHLPEYYFPHLHSEHTLCNNNYFVKSVSKSNNAMGSYNVHRNTTVVC